MVSRDNVAFAGAPLRRPRLHFTPAANWLNDPNGLVYYDGEYHLFYQHHPHSSVWGPMHWGHAVSTDLITWQELPIALYPDALGMIFSGSAVIDRANSAGFGRDAMVAIFTHHVEAGHQQCQSIAFSLDRGRTWTKYAGNPVIPTPPETRDFRDPKVFWYGDLSDGHWVMCLAVGRAIHFYSSPNLIDWSFSSSFGDGYGCTTGVWETPDLFELPVLGTAESRWVLLVGVGDGAPAGGSGQQYFVGRFDGAMFTCDDPPEQILWFDYGADCYAAQSWSNAPDARRLAIAWMSNWLYAPDVPTHPWRGAMTLPRELSLCSSPQGPRLCQRPVIPPPAEVGKQRLHVQDMTVDAGAEARYRLTGAAVWQLELLLVFTDPALDQAEVRLEFGDSSAHVLLRFCGRQQTLCLDRRSAGESAFHPAFARIHRAPLALHGNRLAMQLIVDTSSVELFAADGTLSMTELVFPRASLSAVAVIAPAGNSVTIASLRATELASGSG